MPARTGAQFLQGLRDRRALWLGGQRVTDPMDHPALRGAAEAIARCMICIINTPTTA